MSATKLMIAGAKGQTNRIATILATHPVLEVRNVSPEDIRSNWVVTGTMANLFTALGDLSAAHTEDQLYIHAVMLTGECVNGVFE